jgi:outer membrane receptor protein involved in Fe transport
VNFPLTTPAGTFAGFGISNSLGGGEVLEPEFTKSFEVGTNLGFFNNRVTFDLTYFKTVSSNQIFAVTVPGSSGYATRLTNIGQLDNKGFEALVNITPVRGNFTWDISANFTRIRNKVVSIAPDVTQSFIDTDAFTGFQAAIVEGQPYGVIIGGGAIPRVTDPNSPYFNRYIINGNTGNFAAGVANKIIGDPNPDWQGGLTNTVGYKGISLSFLVDATVGGDVFSRSNQGYRAAGMLKEQAEKDRSLPRILPGVIQQGTNADGTPNYVPNNIQIDAQSYWTALSPGGSGSDLNVFDATVYRLREVSLGYTLPKALLSKTPFGGASISFTGRNLYYYAPNANFDPDVSTQGAGNSSTISQSTVRGLELQGSPNTRNYGVNLRFTL